ncbi:MAG TPA: hypothetical protein VN181_13505, partial [Thermoanaerobaculia bacterium]|nr:hypothetical protein [Thermoanaerobaculia bacterium]
YVEYRYSFQQFESEPDRVLNIELEPAITRRIAVVTPAGMPIAGATVVDETGNARAPWLTGADGTAAIPLRQNEQKILYVFPKEGSLAVARVAPTGSDTNDVIKIVVPQGEADLSIRAESDEGEPIANAAFIIRVNGELLPAAVIAIAEQVQGQRLRTDGTGTAMLYKLPAGLIELWPYFSAQDARSIKQGTGPAPKAQINIRPGLNQIKLTFAPYAP